MINNSASNIIITYMSTKELIVVEILAGHQKSGEIPKAGKNVTSKK
jgi:hypothetical protein